MKPEQIVRVSKDREHPYTMISNRLLQDNSLSWAARGMMAYLLSKPDNWQVRMADLMHSGAGAGRQATQSIIKELAAAGYIERRRENAAGGLFRYVTIIFESPIAKAQPETDETPAPVDGSTDDVTAMDGNTIDGSTVNGLTVNGEAVHIVTTDSLLITEETSDTNVSHAGHEPVGDTVPDKPKREQTPEQRAQNEVKRQVREHFETRTKLSMPEGANRKGLAAQWWNPIREICVLAGYDVERAKRLVDESVRRLDGLTIADPNSILKTARAIVAEHKAGPQRARAHGGSAPKPAIVGNVGTRWG